jgi:hypothetical protein
MPADFAIALQIAGSLTTDGGGSGRIEPCAHEGKTTAQRFRRSLLVPVGKAMTLEQGF